MAEDLKTETSVMRRAEVLAADACSAGMRSDCARELGGGKAKFEALFLGQTRIEGLLTVVGEKLDGAKDAERDRTEELGRVLGKRVGKVEDRVTVVETSSKVMNRWLLRGLVALAGVGGLGGLGAGVKAALETWFRDAP